MMTTVVANETHGDKYAQMMIWFIRHWTTLIGAQFADCKLRLAADSVKWVEKSEMMAVRRLRWGAVSVSFVCVLRSMGRLMINWVAESWHLCCDLLAVHKWKCTRAFHCDFGNVCDGIVDSWSCRSMRGSYGGYFAAKCFDRVSH